MEQNIENYTIQELEALILAPNIKDKEFKREILCRRQALLNEQFDFAANREHIERVNNILLRKMNELYDKMRLVKHDLDEQITFGKELYKDYNCSGEIYFEVNDDGKLSHERRVLLKLCNEARCHWCIYNDSEKEMQERTEYFLDELNWDIEVFKPIQEWRLHICYATHAIFADDFVLSLQDMVYLEEGDIYTKIEINII
ncbi:hypothetical protein [uncultured Bacteroides sp.]|uniref:hypothetical protein n=1 Tax=uncultured Bacteroides sp. TaxID=162156 RepID=UPI0025FB2457|nr:hypothetical protein [uncultured Bacteroides sp.]